MRIGLLAPPWVAIPPPAYGGTELAIDQLARGLHAGGHDVRLFTTGDSTCPVERACFYPGSLGDEMGNAAFELAHVVAGYEALADCDVVHDHTLTGPFYAHGLSRVPVVTTNHGPFRSPLLEIYRPMSRVASVIAISHSQAAAASGVSIAAVIHHGIDIGEFPAGSGDGDEEGPYLLFLGRMHADKGVHRAVAVARAAGWRLLIAAKMREPLEKRYFEEWIEPQLGHDVRYVGEVDRSTKLALLAGASALLNPIRWPEPFGLVMIEAMACGTPVLAFPEGAACEIVRNGVNGWLCRDEAAMVARLPATVAIDRAHCRQNVADRFSTAIMVDKHVALFTEVVQHHAPRAA